MNHEGRSRHQRVGLILGPLLSIGMMISGAPADLSEAVPIAATALLPIVIFLVSLIALHLAPKFL